MDSEVMVTGREISRDGPLHLKEDKRAKFELATQRMESIAQKASSPIKKMTIDVKQPQSLQNSVRQDLNGRSPIHFAPYQATTYINDQGQHHRLIPQINIRPDHHFQFSKPGTSYDRSEDIASRNANNFSSRASSMAAKKKSVHLQKMAINHIVNRQRRRNQTLIHGKKTALFPLASLSIGRDDGAGKGGKQPEAGVTADIATSMGDGHFKSPRDSFKFTEQSLHAGTNKSYLQGSKLGPKHSVDVGTLRVSQERAREQQSTNSYEKAREADEPTMNTKHPSSAGEPTVMSNNTKQESAGLTFLQQAANDTSIAVSRPQTQLSTADGAHLSMQGPPSRQVADIRRKMDHLQLSRQARVLSQAGGPRSGAFRTDTFNSAAASRCGPRSKAASRRGIKGAQLKDTFFTRASDRPSTFQTISMFTKSRPNSKPAGIAKNTVLSDSGIAGPQNRHVCFSSTTGRPDSKNGKRASLLSSDFIPADLRPMGMALGSSKNNQGNPPLLSTVELNEFVSKMPGGLQVGYGQLAYSHEESISDHDEVELATDSPLGFSNTTKHEDTILVKDDRLGSEAAVESSIEYCPLHAPQTKASNLARHKSRWVARRFEPVQSFRREACCPGCNFQADQAVKTSLQGTDMSMSTRAEFFNARKQMQQPLSGLSEYEPRQEANATTLAPAAPKIVVGRNMLNQTMNSMPLNRVERSWLHARRVDLVSPNSLNGHSGLYGAEVLLDQLRFSLNTSPRSPNLIDGTIVGNKIAGQTDVMSNPKTDHTNIYSQKSTARGGARPAVKANNLKGKSRQSERAGPNVVLSDRERGLTAHMAYSNDLADVQDAAVESSVRDSRDRKATAPEMPSPALSEAEHFTQGTRRMREIARDGLESNSIVSRNNQDQAVDIVAEGPTKKNLGSARNLDDIVGRPDATTMRISQELLESKDQRKIAQAASLPKVSTSEDEAAKREVSSGDVPVSKEESTVPPSQMKFRVNLEKLEKINDYTQPPGGETEKVTKNKELKTYNPRKSKSFKDGSGFIKRGNATAVRNGASRDKIAQDLSAMAMVEAAILAPVNPASSLTSSPARAGSKPTTPHRTNPEGSLVTDEKSILAFQGPFSSSKHTASPVKRPPVRLDSGDRHQGTQLETVQSNSRGDALSHDMHEGITPKVVIKAHKSQKPTLKQVEDPELSQQPINEKDPLFLILERDHHQNSQLQALEPLNSGGAASQLIEKHQNDGVKPEVSKFGVAIYKILREHGVLSVMKNIQDKESQLDTVAKFKRKCAFDKAFKRKMRRFFEDEQPRPRRQQTRSPQQQQEQASEAAALDEMKELVLLTDLDEQVFEDPDIVAPLPLVEDLDNNIKTSPQKTSKQQLPAAKKKRKLRRQSTTSYGSPIQGSPLSDEVTPRKSPTMATVDSEMGIILTNLNTVKEEVFDFKVRRDSVNHYRSSSPGGAAGGPFVSKRRSHGTSRSIQMPDVFITPSHAHHQHFYENGAVSKFRGSPELLNLAPEQKRLNEAFQQRYHQVPLNRRKWRKERRKGLKESIKKRFAQIANSSAEGAPLKKPDDFGVQASLALAEQSLSMSQSSGSSSSSQDGMKANRASALATNENLTLTKFIKKLQRRVGDIQQETDRDPVDDVDTSAALEQNAMYMRKLQEQIRQHLLVPEPGFHDQNPDAVEHMIELSDSHAPQEIEVYAQGDAEEEFPRLFRIHDCHYNKVYILQLRSIVEKRKSKRNDDEKLPVQDVEVRLRFPYQPEVYVRNDDINGHATRIQQIKFVPSPPKGAPGEPIDPELLDFNLFGSLQSTTGCRLIVNIICPEKERAKAREALAKRLRLESHLARKGNTKRDTAAILKMTRDEVLAAEADLFEYLRAAQPNSGRPQQEAVDSGEEEGLPYWIQRNIDYIGGYKSKYDELKHKRRRSLERDAAARATLQRRRQQLQAQASSWQEWLGRWDKYREQLFFSKQVLIRLVKHGMRVRRHRVLLVQRQFVKQLVNIHHYVKKRVWYMRASLLIALRTFYTSKVIMRKYGPNPTVRAKKKFFQLQLPLWTQCTMATIEERAKQCILSTLMRNKANEQFDLNCRTTYQHIIHCQRAMKGIHFKRVIRTKVLTNFINRERSFLMDFIPKKLAAGTAKQHEKQLQKLQKKLPVLKMDYVMTLLPTLMSMKQIESLKRFITFKKILQEVLIKYLKWLKRNTELVNRTRAFMVGMDKLEMMTELQVRVEVAEAKVERYIDMLDGLQYRLESMSEECLGTMGSKDFVPMLARNSYKGICADLDKMYPKSKDGPSKKKKGNVGAKHFPTLEEEREQALQADQRRMAKNRAQDIWRSLKVSMDEMPCQGLLKPRTSLDNEDLCKRCIVLKQQTKLVCVNDDLAQTLARRAEQYEQQAPSDSEDEDAWKDCETCSDMNVDQLKKKATIKEDAKASKKAGKSAATSPKGKKDATKNVKIERCQNCVVKRGRRLEKKFEHITEYWTGNNFSTLFQLFNVIRSDYVLREDYEKAQDFTEQMPTKEEVIRTIITATTFTAD